MSVLRYLFCIDINMGLRSYQASPGAVLLDVRDRREYDRKHIEGSLSLPLSEIHRAGEVIPSQDTPVYLYAYGGETSFRAAEKLRRMGYTGVHDIGGIKKCCGSQGYQGRMVAGEGD